MKKIAILILFFSSVSVAQHKEINFAWVRAIADKNLDLDSLIAVTFPDARVRVVTDDLKIVDLDSVPMYGVQGKLTATIRKDYIDSSITRSELEWTSATLSPSKFPTYALTALSKLGKPKKYKGVTYWAKKNFFASWGVAALNEMEDGMYFTCSIKK